MAFPSFAAMAPSYARLWAALEPTPEHMPALTKICQGLIAHKATYKAVSQTVWGTPDFWYVPALIDQMEGGGGACTYLGNGQSLKHPTTEVPAGRGPFASFHDGAVNALHLDGLDQVKEWPIERVAYQLEAYNGWGYLSKPINDPYLAAQSNMYTAGKYVADHVYDPNAVSEQPGALTILKVLIALDPTLFAQAVALAPEPARQPEIPPVTATAAAPAAAAPLQIDYAALAAALLAAQPNLVAPPAPAVVPVAPALPQISLASIQAHLNVFLPLVTMVMAAIPATAPFAPMVTVAQNAIQAVDDVVTTVQTNPAALPATLAGHLADVAPLLAALRPLSAQWPWLTTLETIVGNAANALTPPVAPAAPAKGTGT